MDRVRLEAVAAFAGVNRIIRLAGPPMGRSVMCDPCLSLCHLSQEHISIAMTRQGIMQFVENETCPSAQSRSL